MQKFNSHITEVIQQKISNITALTELRKEQSKLYFKYKKGDIDYSRYNPKLELFEAIRREEEIESKIRQIPSLYSLFGYICLNDKGETIQTWDIELNNDVKNLKKILKENESKTI
jgi:ubiquitin C-terminal hydrolase